MIIKKVVFIVNPISGTKGKEAILKQIESSLDKNKYTYEIKKTEYAGHAALLAEQAAKDGIDIVVAIGGDGTVNEVARSLTHTNTALGIIPCGSGNGLARHLQISMEAKKAIDIINKGVVESVDYGKINGLPFFCTCGVGFDAFISAKFAQAGKRGPLTYLENTLREGVRYKPETYEIEDEAGTHKYKAFLIACANASQYGNNAYIAPNASMSDGLMDVTVMEPFNMLEATAIALQLFTKTIEKNSCIKSFRCKKLTIHRSKPGVIHYDGDPVMSDADVEVEMISGGLKVVVNTEAKPMVFNFVKTFFEYVNLDAFHTEVLDKVRSEIVRTNRKILILNRDILRKLTKQQNKQ